MLELAGISKRFGDHTALSDIRMKVAPGEIHGLLGLNGSGKSTLLNILAGAPVIRDTGGFSGHIRVKGKTAVFNSPAQAFKIGIGMVHQESSLFSRMTVAENIKLGREHVTSLSRLLPGRNFALPDTKKNMVDVENVLQKMGLTLNPLTRIKDLSVSQRQLIEFAREMDRSNLSVLLLDEPTASLNRKDAGILLSLVNEIAGAGVAVVYVSHSLAEVMTVCHGITVLKEGKICAAYGDAEFDVDRITNAMVGNRVIPVQRHRQKNSTSTILSLNNLSADMNGDAVSNVNLDIYKGEILGIAGLSGHGKSAVGPAVMGLCPSSGNIVFKDRQMSRKTPDMMVAEGLCLLADDRRYSILHEHSVMENIVFTAVRKIRLFHRKGMAGWMGFTDKKKVKQYAEQCVERFHIHCRSIFQKAGELSGGNQQKLSLARILAGGPNVLFAGEVTRGIDLNAREVILNLLLKANEEKGTTIVLSSEEPDELKRICDRIAVFHENRLVGILPPDSGKNVFAKAFCGEKVRV